MFLNFRASQPRIFYFENKRKLYIMRFVDGKGDWICSWNAVGRAYTTFEYARVYTYVVQSVLG